MLSLLLAVLVVLIGPFMAGLRGYRIAAAIWIASPLLFGLLFQAEQPAGFDQPHLGVGLGLIASGIALLAWLVGWLIRAVIEEGEASSGI